VNRTAMRAVLVAVGLLMLVSGCTRPTPQTPGYVSADPEGYVGGSSLPQPYTMPDVSLTDTAGRPYNLATSPSRPVTLMFFGYTKCPDVCITVLSDLALALQRLDAAERDHIQVVFVTTDPARDKPAVIRKYLDGFDPTFVGLTGSLATIKQAAGQVGVDIEGMKKLPSGGYEVGHSSQVIGFNRTSGVVLWTPETAIADLKHDFALLVEKSR
jgi:protein SCO1/2